MFFPRTFRPLLTALVGAVAVMATLPASSGAVVKGTTALHAGDFPWTVAVVSRGFTAYGGQFCGGTLVGPRRVLTAAHCIDPAGPNQALAGDLDVVIGQTTLSKTGRPDDEYQAQTRIRVADISLHADADVSKYRYDVAQLTLEHAIPPGFDDAIVEPIASSGSSTTDVQPPMPLTGLTESTTPEAWGAGTKLAVFGWGVTGYGMSPSTASPTMRFAVGSASTPFQRLSDEACTTRHRTDYNAADMLCVGDPNPSTPGQVTDTCQGDSGGPLLKQAVRRTVPLPTTEELDLLTADELAKLTDQEKQDWTDQELAAWRAADLAALTPEQRTAWTEAERSVWTQERLAALRANPNDSQLADWAADDEASYRAEHPAPVEPVKPYLRTRPADPDEPLAPAEPTEPVEPTDPEAPDYAAAHAQWTLDHATWVDEHATWQIDHNAWEADHATWSTDHEAWLTAHPDQQAAHDAWELDEAAWQDEWNTWLPLNNAWIADYAIWEQVTNPAYVQALDASIAEAVPGHVWALILVETPDAAVRQARYDAAIATRIAAQVAARAATPEGEAMITAMIQAKVRARVIADEDARVGQEQMQRYPIDGAHWRLVGVVSWGYGCGEARYPGVYARVGAPLIREYVTDASPPSMPTLDGTELPSIRGRFELGTPMVCVPGRWRGDPKKYSIEMWRDINANGVRDASTDLRIASTDGVRIVSVADILSPYPIGCTVTARGPGGYSSANAPTFNDLTVVIPKLPGGATTPDTPPPPKVLVDKSGPVLASRSAVCSTTSCRVSVIAIDRGETVSGVKFVSGTLVRYRKGKCRTQRGKNKGKLVSCTKKTTKKVTFRRAGDIWVGKVTGLRATDRTRLSVRTADQVGNAGSTVLAVKLKLRKR